MFTYRVSMWLYLVTLTLAPCTAVGQATPVRTADASCARCHGKIYRDFLATPMANASGLASDNLKSGKFLHKASGAEYEILSLHGKPTLTFRNTAGSGELNVLPLSYFLGSGHLGTTYLYSINNYLFESPVAWYAASQGYDMKPGLAEMQTMPPPLPMQSSCLRCHMSSAQPSDAGTINRYQNLAFLHTGITCESCHGDAQQHVLTRGKAAVLNPARLDAKRRDSICISCHLEGDVSVERKGRSALQYRPGESIFDYLSYYVLDDARLTARGVSEVEQLDRSTCKRASGDKMSCSSCHDPHYTPDAQHRAGFFRSKCLACHNEPKFARSHHPENQDCTSCHMHRTGAINIPHVAWTDHRILKLPEGATLEQTSKKADALVPLLATESSERDLAMAYYQLLLEGDRSFEANARARLDAQQEAIANDKEALDALGNLSVERGDYELGEHVFRRVLELDAHDLTALSNLGILLAKRGKPKDAVPLLKSAFDRNLDIPALAMNLARVQCVSGDGAAARSTLTTALLYCPNLEDMRRLLTQMDSCDAGGK